MVIQIFILVVVVGIAIIFHEVAHGWVALKLGDTTARDQGRLTLNPLKHIDPVGSILVPGILIYLRSKGVGVVPFGWARPVPVNLARLRSPRKDMLWVALAGPMVNIVLALMAALYLKLFPQSIGAPIAGIAIFINILLAVFNMIPIPPLDGSRVLMRFLPKQLALPYSKLERYGILIVFGLLYLGLFEKFVLPIVEQIASLLGVGVL